MIQKHKGNVKVQNEGKQRKNSIDNSALIAPPYQDNKSVNASTNKTTTATLFRGMSIVEPQTTKAQSLNPETMNPSRLVNYLYATSTNKKLTG